MTFPQTILPIKGEIFVNSAWTDITSFIYSRDSVSISRGRSDESQQVQPSAANCTLDNRTGRFSPRNPNGAYYGQLGRNTPFRLAVLSTSYLQIDVDTGITGTAVDIGANTPDNAALDVANDIMLTVDADLTSWREDAQLLSKWNSNTANRSYQLFLRSTGQLRAYFSGDGATSVTFDSTAPVPLVTGRQSVRVTLDANNGAGCTVQFYVGDSMNGTYTQLGDTIFGGSPVTIFNGTATLVTTHAVNNVTTNASVRARVYAAQVRDGISPGTIVANPDFTAQADGATSFTDSAGRVWTTSGAAFITTRDTRFAGEMSTWPQAWDISDADVYTQVTASGPLRRLSQGSSALHSTLYRGITHLSGVNAPVAYWPMEDADGSTRLASGLPNGFNAGISGGPPSLASFDGFPSSSPIPTFGGAAFPGAVPIYTSTGAVQVRFLIAMPAGGSATGVLLRVNTLGTANRWDVIYTAGSGGLISLNVYDSTTDPDTNLLTSSPAVFNMDGRFLRFSLQLNNSGSNVAWSENTAQLNVGGLGGLGGTLTGRQIGRVTTVTLNPNKTFTDTAVGHLTVQTVITPNSDLTNELNAYLNETSGRRMQRVCKEENQTFQGDGDLDDTAAMGPQLPITLLALIQDCAEVDQGLLYETRDRSGLGYRPRTALYRQPPDVTLNYAAHQMSSLIPVEDDQNVHNDITISRTSGSSYRAALTSGHLSTQAPPNGIGVYDLADTVNVAQDSDLDDQAGWRLRLGTVDEARYPTITTNLAAPEFALNAALTAQTTVLDVGSRIAIVNPPAWLPPEAISEIVQGTSESLSQYERTLVFNTSPSVPYDTVGVYGPTSATLTSRYSSLASTLGSSATSAATTLSVATPSGPLWTHADGDFDVIVAGERMTVTNVTGSSSPQSFTVTRSVNGIVKAQSSGVSVDLFTPAYYAL